MTTADEFFERLDATQPTGVYLPVSPVEGSERTIEGLASNLLVNPDPRMEYDRVPLPGVVCVDPELKNKSIFDLRKELLDLNEEARQIEAKRARVRAAIAAKQAAERARSLELLHPQDIMPSKYKLSDQNIIQIQKYSLNSD
jgi:hypothetical protein